MASTTRSTTHVDSHERRKVLLVGDSITQQSFSVPHGGWGAGLQDWYQRTADVFNRGFSGYNSRWIRQSLHKIFPESSPLNKDVMLVVLLLGSNDSACPPSAQHISVEEYSDNLSFIIDHFVSIFPGAQFIVITPPQVDNQQWPDRSIPQVAEYAAAARKVAMNHIIPILDLWRDDEFLVTPADLRDGLHLGRSGNKKVGEGIQALIRSAYPQLVPEDNELELPNMTYHMPQHKDLGVLNSASETKSMLEKWSW
jgi:isoamyl acetate esterase